MTWSKIAPTVYSKFILNLFGPFHLFSSAVKENWVRSRLRDWTFFNVTIYQPPCLLQNRFYTTRIETKTRFRIFAKLIFVSTLYTFIQLGRPTRINDSSVIKTMQRMMPHLFSLLNNEEEEEQKQPTRHLEKKSASSSSSSSSDDEEPQAK